MKRTLKPVFPPAAIETKYRQKLERLVEEMRRSCVWWLRARYRANEDKILDSATDDMLKEFRRLLRQWEGRFRDDADDYAEWFARSTRNYTTRNLKAQLDKLKKLGLGFNLEFRYMSQKERQVFNAIVYENVNLIKSIASQCLTQVEGIVMRAIQNGFDLGTLTENLEHEFDVTHRRAAMIARDQTAKATNNLSRQRLMDYGITRGIWMHTSAGKTYRETHVEMDGTEYNIADGCFDEHEGRAVQPAELVNCHCVCRPVVPAFGLEEHGEQIFGDEGITIKDEAEIIGWASHEDGQHYPIHAAQGNGGRKTAQNKSSSKEGKQTSASNNNNRKDISRPKNEQTELKQFNVYDPSTKTDAEKLEQVNPNYDTGERKWTNNCQRCVVAYELQQRGYDVTSLPFKANDEIGNSGIAVWNFDANNKDNDPGFAIVPLKSDFKKVAKDSFDKWGDGARAIVRVQWQRQYGGNGHFFIARRVGDKIIYEDPQSGKIRDIEDTLSKCTPNYKKIWIMRVDNRDVSDKVKYAVQNRKGEDNG